MSKLSSILIALSLLVATGAFAGEAHDSPEGIFASGHPATKEPTRDPQSQVDAASIPSTLGEVYRSMYGEHHQVGEAKPIPDTYSMPTYPLPKR